MGLSASRAKRLAHQNSIFGRVVLVVCALLLVAVGYVILFAAGMQRFNPRPHDVRGLFLSAWALFSCAAVIVTLVWRSAGFRSVTMNTIGTVLALLILLPHGLAGDDYGAVGVTVGLLVIAVPSAVAWILATRREGGSA